MQKFPRRFDGIRVWSGAMTGVAFATLAAGGIYLAAGSIPALRDQGMKFFTGPWAYRQHAFGASSMLYGSAVVAAIALLLAIPVAIGTAVFTSEICSRRPRMLLKVTVELLAGIPSVVYGLLGVLFLRDWIGSALERFGSDALSPDTLLTAGVLLAVMVLPTIATLADDALHAVAPSVREAARGLGLTRGESIVWIVLPRATSGIVAAVLLGFGRAAGETIAVFLVVGRADNRLPHSLFSLTPIADAGQTITSKLGGSEANIAAGDPLHSSALFALALLLLVVVLAATSVAETLRSRLAEREAL
jgi:phosphate transport system permease protein